MYGDNVCAKKRAANFSKVRRAAPTAEFAGLRRLQWAESRRLAFLELPAVKALQSSIQALSR
jgi:hypothetical protein